MVTGVSSNLTSRQSGTFITVEGPDGAGKTTQLAYIEKWLTGRGIPVRVTREPGGTRLGEQLRELLLHRNDVSISDETELLLMFAARQQHIKDVIIPAFDNNHWVLCDRFTDASYAYQGAGRGIPAQRIGILEDWVQGDLQPDLTLVLDVDVSVGIRRSAQRSADPDKDADRFECQAMAFKQAVRDCYLQRAKDEPGRVKVIDAAQDMESVQRDIGVVLDQFVAQTGLPRHG